MIPEHVRQPALVLSGCDKYTHGASARCIVAIVGDDSVDIVGVIQMSESGEHRTARCEVQTAGQIDVALSPEGRQLIHRLIRGPHTYVRDLHIGEVQL